MDERTFQYIEVGKVQCPKCGHFGEIGLQHNSGQSLQYAGVCQSRPAKKAPCGAMLVLQVTAHVFPEAPARA